MRCRMVGDAVVSLERLPLVWGPILKIGAGKTVWGSNPYRSAKKKIKEKETTQNGQIPHSPRTEEHDAI